MIILLDIIWNIVEINKLLCQAACVYASGAVMRRCVV